MQINVSLTQAATIRISSAPNFPAIFETLAYTRAATNAVEIVSSTAVRGINPLRRTGSTKLAGGHFLMIEYGMCHDVT